MDKNSSHTWSSSCIHNHIFALPTTPSSPSKASAIDRQVAKERVVRVVRNGVDWLLAASHNNVSFTTARRAVLGDGTPLK